MSNNIDWLPNIVRLEDYYDGTNFDFVQLINDCYNEFINDFYNNSSPVMFQGRRVFLQDKLLSCDKLEVKNCYNKTFYNCLTCPFEQKLDIFNHICTIEYTNKMLKKKGGKLRLKKEFKKSGQISIPRTPGEFCIPRLLLSSWIKPIILHADDKEQVIVNQNGNTYTLELINRKYKIHLVEITPKTSNKYYFLKTAYFYTIPKEIIDQENYKYILKAKQNYAKNRKETPLRAFQ